MSNDTNARPTLIKDASEFIPRSVTTSTDTAVFPDHNVLDNHPVKDLRTSPDR